jgi:spore maturation protein SpmB
MFEGKSHYFEPRVPMESHGRFAVCIHLPVVMNPLTTQASLVQSGGAQGATLIVLNPKDTMTNSKLQIVSTCFNMFQIQKSSTALSACDVTYMLHICLLYSKVLSHLVTLFVKRP